MYTNYCHQDDMLGQNVEVKETMPWRLIQQDGVLCPIQQKFFMLYF